MGSVLWQVSCSTQGLLQHSSPDRSGLAGTACGVKHELESSVQSHPEGRHWRRHMDVFKHPWSHTAESSLFNLGQLPHLKGVTIQYNLPTSVIILGEKYADSIRWCLLKYTQTNTKVWSVDYQSENAFGDVWEANSRVKITYGTCAGGLRSKPGETQEVSQSHELRSQASSLKVSLVDTVLRLCAPSPPVCGHYLYREEISSRHVWWFERK